MKKRLIIGVLLLLVLAVILKIFVLDAILFRAKKEKELSSVKMYYAMGNYDVSKRLIDAALFKYPADKEFLEILELITNEENEKKEKEKNAADLKNKRDREYYVNLINRLLRQISEENNGNGGQNKLKSNSNDVTGGDFNANYNALKKKYINTEGLKKLFEEASKAYLSKDYALAKYILYNALNIDYQNPLLNSFLATVLFEENPENKKNIEDSMVFAQRSVEVEKNIESSHFILGQIYSLRGLKQEAIDEYLLTLKINPSNYTVYYLAGRIYVDLKEYQRAIDFFNNSIKIKSDFISALYYLAVSERAVDSIVSAKEHLLKIIDFKSNFYQAYVELGDIYFEEQKYDFAVKEYTEAFSLNRNYEYLIKCGDSFRNIKNYNKAIDYYESAIGENKMKVDDDKKRMFYCFSEIINIKTEMGDKVSALSYIDRAMTILGKVAVCLYPLSADLKLAQGLNKNALNDYITAIENESDRSLVPMFYYKAGLCCYNMKDFSKAVAYLNKSIEEDGEKNYDGYYLLGQVFFEMKRYVEARQIFQKLSGLDPLYEKDKVSLFLEKINKKVL